MQAHQFMEPRHTTKPRTIIHKKFEHYEQLFYDIIGALYNCNRNLHVFNKLIDSLIQNWNTSPKLETHRETLSFFVGYPHLLFFHLRTGCGYILTCTEQWVEQMN